MTTVNDKAASPVQADHLGETASKTQGYNTTKPALPQESTGNLVEALHLFQNIPDELKALPNFVLWRKEERDGKITKIPVCPHTGYNASVTNPATWASFTDCLAALPASGTDGIGFVLTPESNLICIDLDHTDDPTEQQRQQGIAQAFNSFQEVSQSGKGLHIWLKGSIPTGRRRGCVEMYSSGRFMVMTGNVHNPAPIAEYPELTHQLWAELSPDKEAWEDQGVNLDQRQTDEQILEAAMGAVNGDKFSDLWDGEWERHFPSQSEADFALINIIAYYSKNRVQITRMFRNSGLGKRAKALRAGYTEPMVMRAFDNQPAEIDLSAFKMNMQQAFIDSLKPPVVAELPVSEAAIELQQLSPEVYTPPAGMIGELAAFIYAVAPRPVPEIALAAAIGLMAGVCGRCYNISGTGLNQYTLLIARQGRGKEGMGKGISKLIGSILPTIPLASTFNGPARIASQEALMKHISKKSKSFVSTMGEFADTLKRMSNDSHNPAQQGVKQAMLDLYNKSGKGDILGELIYSDVAKNTDSITAPAFSVLGEATPDKFYELLTESMINEGFLPRFTIIEYHGNRPSLNKNHSNTEVPERLKEAFGQLCAYSLQLNSSDNVIKIQTSSEAEKCLDEFDKRCDDLINSGNSVSAELWTRAHLKVLRLAGLLAAGTNYINPCVSIDQALWAIRLIESDINNILRRFDSGEVGSNTGEIEQAKAMVKEFKNYVTSDWSKIANYNAGPEKLHSDYIISYSYISKRLRGLACFKNDRYGATKAIMRTIENLQIQGDIKELPSKAISDNYNFGGRCYMIANTDTFLN